MTDRALETELEGFVADFKALRREMAKVIVGRGAVVDQALSALIAGGHVLVEGLPGVGKTVLARTLAEAVDLSYQRIQCTPDLMPADVIGTYVIMETPQGRRTFEFQKGPAFANIVLADQVNRSTPKTQSALLQAMDEGSITVSTEDFRLPEPHFVIATQNPSEMEGTFPLPEAQLDRFLFKLRMGPPDCDEMEQILDRTTEGEQADVRKTIDGRRVLDMGRLVRRVPIDGEARRWAVAVVAATRPEDARAPDVVRRFVCHGSSARGAQAMVLAGKIRAILAGRSHVALEDLEGAAHAALRHRLILNFEGQSENVEADGVIDAVLDAVEKPAGS